MIWHALPMKCTSIAVTLASDVLRRSVSPHCGVAVLMTRSRSRPASSTGPENPVAQRPRRRREGRDKGGRVIGLVTDSNAQLPPDLRERYQVGVVPLTVVVGGCPYREGVDITSAEFYERLGSGAEVSTAAPSPGEVLEVYEQAASGGATEVLSIHIGSNTSATINAVKVAAGSSPVPVEIVDTGTASFAVACCVWAAGEVLNGGGDLSHAADVTRRVAGCVGNVFIVGALDLARRGGRLAPA